MAFNGQPPDHMNPHISGRKLMAFVVLGFLVLGLIGMLGYSKLIAYVQGNAAYEEGVDLLQNSNVAEAILGSPIKVDSMVSGNVRTHNERGVADYTLEVSGSKCAGMLYLHGEKLNDCWSLTMWVLNSDCADSPLILRNPGSTHIQGDTSQEA